MIDPPSEIRIGPHVFRVTLVKDGVMDETCGQTFVKRLVIAVDAEQRPSQVAAVILHEVIHGLLDLTDLSTEDEEKVALLLGAGLLALVMDNPGLVAYLSQFRPNA